MAIHGSTPIKLKSQNITVTMDASQNKIKILSHYCYFPYLLQVLTHEEQLTSPLYWRQDSPRMLLLTSSAVLCASVQPSPLMCNGLRAPAWTATHHNSASSLVNLQTTFEPLKSARDTQCPHETAWKGPGLSLMYELKASVLNTM